MRDVDWLRGELQRWAHGLPGVEAQAGERWTLVGPQGGDALPVRVEIDRAPTVEIGPWAPPIEDAGEAADLAAAALFGRIRAEVGRVQQRWVRYRLALRVGERWVEIASLRRTHLAFWKRPLTAVLRNTFAVPSGVVLTPGGALPYAPWVGLLAEPEADRGPAPLPVDGELDLHPFKPKEVAGVVRAYIDECLERGIFELRVVHGKGIGNLRRTVHALLDKHPAVAGYRLGGSGGGSWGATVVDLKRPPAS